MQFQGGMNVQMEENGGLHVTDGTDPGQHGDSIAVAVEHAQNHAHHSIPDRAKATDDAVHPVCLSLVPCVTLLLSLVPCDTVCLPCSG